ncbi:MAG: bifunctional nuclease family protein [Paramuribaculum sp.]|nr:bifunctional nuclease family protein [Paramuribaculum sp.]
MAERIRLKVLGISYSQLQTGAYALILAQVDGPYRIPVLIGSAEAQSIALRMESVTPPRPMTHDLFVSFAHAFGVKLKEVFIYKFEDGIFSSELTFSDGDRTVIIDSRTSDAIAIAMRTGAPIYTTPEIIDETGFIMEVENDPHQDRTPDDGEYDDYDDDEEDDETDADEDEEYGEEYPEEESDEEEIGISGMEPKLENYAIEELERTLKKLIDQERYEEASKVSEILKRKKSR